MVASSQGTQTISPGFGAGRRNVLGQFAGDGHQGLATILDGLVTIWERLVTFLTNTAVSSRHSTRSRNGPRRLVVSRSNASGLSANLTRSGLCHVIIASTSRITVDY